MYVCMYVYNMYSSTNNDATLLEIPWRCRGIRSWNTTRQTKNQSSTFEMNDVKYHSGGLGGSRYDVRGVGKSWSGSPRKMPPTTNSSTLGIALHHTRPWVRTRHCIGIMSILSSVVGLLDVWWCSRCYVRSDCYLAPPRHHGHRLPTLQAWNLPQQ